MPQTEEVDRVVNLFTGIYGVGDSIATRWYNMGWRSLGDVRAHESELTHDQRIGLKYYTDINSKIKRDEMIKINDAVSKAIKDLDPGYEVYLGGSFRREEPVCGDADFVGKIVFLKKVTHLDPKLTSRHSIQVIIRKLEENGIKFIHLTNLLTDHDLYKGLFKLNGLSEDLFRRIDILMVPYDELGSALIQWTGNDLFNRRLRTLAKSRGMKLSQHGLFLVEPDGSLHKIAGKTEMDVFNALGI